MTILEEAQKVVYGDRQDDYGTVLENFNTIAKLWSGVLKVEVTAEQVGLCMVQVKVARQMYKPKRDNLVDGAGYFATLEKMENERNGKVPDSLTRKESRCCGRCDGVNDLCFTDMDCDEHEVQGCEICFGKR